MDLFDSGWVNVALGVTLLFEGVVIIALLHRLEEIRSLLLSVDLPTTEGRLQVGTPAPDFETIAERSGRRVTLPTILPHGGILLFVSGTCSACKRLLVQQNSRDPIGSLFVLWAGAATDLIQLNVRFEFGIANVASIAKSYQVKTFPTAVSLKDGCIVDYMHPLAYKDLEAMETKLFANAKASPA